MTLEVRIVTVALAAFTVAGVAASILVPLLATRRRADRAAVRARQLSRLRLLPARVATCAGLFVAIAFAVFEPRRPDEYMGWVIPAFALLGAAIVIAAGWRWLHIVRATRRLTREWLAAAEPIELPGIGVPAFAVTSEFPIVAVIGHQRPKLVIARSVLHSCTPEELRAILAHEQGHLDRRDNLRRLMLSAAPDILAWLPTSDRYFSAWREAAEEAADDDAAQAGADGRIYLAAALVKVARLASGAAPRDFMPASALYCGENLDGRVRRLLEPRTITTVSAPRAPHMVPALLAVTGLMAVAALALDNLHALIEVAIHRLP